MASHSLNFAPTYHYLYHMDPLDQHREIARLWFSQPQGVSQEAFAASLGITRSFLNSALESNYRQAHQKN